MKLHIALTAIVALTTAGSVTAAPIWNIKPVGDSPNNVYSFYIDGKELNGAFDTIFFQAKTLFGVSFINLNSGAVAGVPRPAGDLFTYPNRMLTADPLDFPGGLALTQVGLVNNGKELSFTAGKLGGTITTANEVNGDLFLGNVHWAGRYTPAVFQIQLISAGNIVYDTGVIGEPEPGSLSIAAIGFLSLLAAGRRLSTSNKSA